MSRSDKSRILHVIGNLGLGGAQSLLYHLWPSLNSSNRYDFEICSLFSLGHFGNRLIEEGAKVHSLDLKGSMYHPTIVATLRNLIRAGSYSIIHAHLFPELYLVPLAAIGEMKPQLVYTEHSVFNRRRRYPFIFKALDRFAYRQYSRIVAVNRSTCISLEKWAPGLANEISVINNSVRTNNTPSRKQEARTLLFAELGFAPNENDRLVLFAGRLSREKGIDVLVKAFGEITDPHRDVILLLAGDGPERFQLENDVKSLGLEDRVIFLGTRSDIIPLLCSVDLLVLPSRWEGLSIVMLEAMAAGCPIVATEVDGTKEVLKDGISARLVPPEQPHSLARVISQVLENSQLRKVMVANALEIVRNHYSADEAAMQLMDLYDSVLSN